MSFRHDPLGALVSQEPAKAHAKLIALFRRYKELRAVAKARGVAGSTVTRWITRLAAAGYADPRVAAGVSNFTMLIENDPATAHERLVALFEEHGQQRKVADALGVQSSSVSRWVEALVAVGYRDPRPSKAA